MGSSLQHLESALLLLGLWRYPAALVSCVSAIETAIVAGANELAGKNIWQLFKGARERGGLSDLSDADQKHLIDARNSIVHRGFSPRDDEDSARLLVRSALPSLWSSYSALLALDLPRALLEGLARQLTLVQRAVSDDRPTSPTRYRDTVIALRHYVAWTVDHRLRPDWLDRILEEADWGGQKWAEQNSRKRSLSGEWWWFNCDVCEDYETFGCRFAEGVDRGPLEFDEALCVSCGLAVPARAAFLTNLLVEDQVRSQRTAILTQIGEEDPGPDL